MKSDLLASIMKGIAALTVGYVALELFLPIINRHGATKEEHRAPVPGEELLNGASIASTHAIDIDAPAETVWNWLIQIGQNRGGFYSYDWLENLVGCRMRNVDRIVPELQNLKIGDQIYLHPKAPPLTVTFLEHARVLALEGWIFTLNSIDTNRTRLLARTYVLSQNPHMGPVGNFIVRSAAFDLAHFIMERKMLKTIKRLAESAVKSRKPMDSLKSMNENSDRVSARAEGRESPFH